MSEHTKTLSTYRFWQKKLVDWKDDISHLIYPNTCLICNQETPNKKIHICHLCETELHHTHFENYLEVTKLDKLFWGRVNIDATYSLLHYEKENSTQEILHRIKYENKKNLAREMGIRIGKQILKIKKFNELDCLIPIPLHKKKEYLRGYNQSLLISEGISQITKTPCLENALTRIKHSESQTKKGRFKRWENVQQTFKIDKISLNNYKHIALIDDVVTTGATLEACVQEIKNNYPELKISIISLAIAN